MGAQSFHPLSKSPFSPFPSKTRTLLQIHVSNSSQLPPIRAPRNDGSPPKQPDHLQLLQKPSPLRFPDHSPKPVDPTPSFLELFKALDQRTNKGQSFFQYQVVGKGMAKVAVEYYEPKNGDFVVGVVLSGNESKLDVSIGADLLGSMLAKEAMPFCKEEMSWLLCDLKEGESNRELLGKGKIGIVRDEEALSKKGEMGRRAIEAGTVIFAEVLGRTLSGRPLLSSRRFFRRVAWNRVRQIMQLNEPIEVTISEWNTGGLLTRIEGIRAFLPKAELMNRVNNFTDLKTNVGRRIHVCISRIDEATNVLIISEREAWDMRYLKAGTLLQGTISKIFPYGAQVRIGQTNRSGLLHVSNITRGERVASVSDVLRVDEEVKVLVIKSLFPDKIFLSTADLESEPGLFLSDREKVFAEAEEMAKKYRKRIANFPSTPMSDDAVSQKDLLPFDDEASLFSNWKWFKFEQIGKV